MRKTNRKPGEGLTLEQLTQKFLAEGKVTEAGLEEARQELATDPEWQAFVASQPQATSR